MSTQGGAKVILVTYAPSGQGLAHYYYLALRDCIGDRVQIVDNPRMAYGGTILNRLAMRIMKRSGLWSRRVLNELRGNASNEAIVILFNLAGLSEPDIRLLSQIQNVRLVGYFSDSPFGMPPKERGLVFKCLPLFQTVVTFARGLVPVFYQFGAKQVLRIPFGYCRYTHLANPREVAVSASNRVYYFGTWTPSIEPWLEHLLSFDLAIEGTHWKNARNRELKRLGAKRHPAMGAEMRRAVRDAAVVVNFVRAQHGCFHSMKTFELPAMGACVVSNRTEEQLEFFRENVDMMFFDTPEEMVDKVRYLLANPDITQRMRISALSAVKGNSYHDRAKFLLNLIN
jgi:spore maturation protein CgeB